MIQLRANLTQSYPWINFHFVINQQFLTPLPSISRWSARLTCRFDSFWVHGGRLLKDTRLPCCLSDIWHLLLDAVCLTCQLGQLGSKIAVCRDTNSVGMDHWCSGPIRFLYWSLHQIMYVIYWLCLNNYLWGRSSTLARNWVYDDITEIACQVFIGTARGWKMTPGWCFIAWIFFQYTFGWGWIFNWVQFQNTFCGGLLFTW